MNKHNHQHGQPHTTPRLPRRREQNGTSKTQPTSAQRITSGARAWAHNCNHHLPRPPETPGGRGHPPRPDPPGHHPVSLSPSGVGGRPSPPPRLDPVIIGVPSHFEPGQAGPITGPDIRCLETRVWDLCCNDVGLTMGPGVLGSFGLP